MRTEIKTAIILGAVIVGVVSSLSVVFSTLETTQTPIRTEIVDENGIQTQSIDKSGFKKAPALVGIAEYINITPEVLEKEIQGK